MPSSVAFHHAIQHLFQHFFLSAFPAPIVISFLLGLISPLRFVCRARRLAYSDRANFQAR